MKMKKIIKAVVCLLLIFAMVVPSVFSTLADTIDYSETSAEGSGEGEWLPIESFGEHAAGIESTDGVNTNQILTGVLFDEGKFIVNLHPYIAGVYDEENNSSAVGNVTVNIYEDCDENACADYDKTPYVNLVTSGTFENIPLENSDINVEVQISDLPETYYLEAVYSLEDGDTVILTERVTSISYTETVQSVENSTVADVLSESGISSDLVENLSPELGLDSPNYFVYRSDSAVIKNDGTYVLRGCDEENTYVLLGVPEEILNTYKTNEELSRIPQLLFIGDFADDFSVYSAYQDGEKISFPLKAKYYRALTENPKNDFEYEYKYAIEYVYPEDIENNNLNDVDPSDLVDSKEVLVSELTEQIEETTGEATEVEDSLETESKAVEETFETASELINETDEPGTSIETADDLFETENPDSKQEEETSQIVDDYVNDAMEGDASKPCGIKFTIETEPTLACVFEQFSIQDFSAIALGEVTKTFSDTINENGVTGNVSLELGFGASGKFNPHLIKKSEVYVKFSVTLNGKYNYVSNGSGGIVNKIIDFPSPARFDVGVASLGLSPTFRINELSGAGEIDGTMNGKAEICMGIGGDGSSCSFSNTLNKYYAGSDTKPLKLDNSVGISFSISAFGALSSSLGTNWGTTVSGKKDTAVVSGVNHRCNTEGSKLGCTHGTVHEYWSGTLGYSIGFWKFKKNFANKTLWNKTNSAYTFYSSKQFGKTDKGDCPYKDQVSLEVKAEPDPGVYLYSATGLKIKLSTTSAATSKPDIYYAVENSDGDTEEQLNYTKYTGLFNLKFNFDDGRKMSIRTVYAYAQYGDTKSEVYQFQYVMLADGEYCLMIPEKLTIPVGEEATVVFVYPSAENPEPVNVPIDCGNIFRKMVQDDNYVSYTHSSLDSTPGFVTFTVKGLKEGKAKLVAGIRIHSGSRKNDYPNKTCEITVTDDLAKPTAQYGTNLYLLRNVSKEGFGEYKDKNTEDSANAPYYYHNGKHSVGEVLSHNSWKEGAGSTGSDIKIYYTTDGSAPSPDNGAEYKAGDKIYLSPESETALSIITLKAIAYNTKTGKKSEVASWTYVIGDKPDLGKARVIMIPTEKRLSVHGVGLCVAIYVPKLTDLVDPNCWIDIKSKDKDGVEKVTPCFKVVWKWRSSGWLTVPVLGTNEWITEPTIGVDFVQTGIVIGLKETGKDKYISITAEGQSKNKADSSKAKGECKVYVYDEEGGGGDTKHKYTVYYNANGGSGAPANQTKTEGEDLTLSSTTPTRDEYTFKGWATSSSSKNVSYNPGDKYTKDGDITLYAVWADKDGIYHIEYDANGGSGAPATQKKQKDVKINLSSTTPTYDGYSFIGWSANKSSKTAEYAPGQEYTQNASLKLYAVWAKGEVYKITYDANGGKGAPATQTKEKGKQVTLSSDVPEYERHVFVEWNTKSDGNGTKYASGAVYNTDQNLTLYAIWRDVKQYTVKYDANGGSGAPADQTKYEGETLILSEQIPTWTGHRFMWWTTESDGSGTGYARGDYYKLDEDVTLYAKWKSAGPYICVLTYDANGGSGAPAPQEASVISGTKISTQTPTRTGYEFCYWSQNKDGSGETYKPGGEIWCDKDTTIYAVWKKAYNLTVENGKTSDGKTTDKIYAGSTVTVIANEPGGDEEFKYWDVVSGDLSLTISQMGSKTLTFTMPESDVVLKAEYRSTKRNIFEVSVINGTANGYEVSYWYAGSQIDAEAAIDEHPNSEFDHWKINGINLNNYEEYCEAFDFVMPENDVVLEAVFIENEKYDLEVVNGKIDETGLTKGQYYEGNTVSITADEPSDEIKEELINMAGELPEGVEPEFYFSCWSVTNGDLTLTEAQRKSASITFSMPASDVKIEASYEMICDPGYNLYVVDGKISSGEYEGETAGIYAKGVTVSAKCDTKEGKVFDYWDADGIKLTDQQKKSPEVTITMPAACVVLTAIFKDAPADTYNLTVIKGTITSGTYKGKTVGEYKAGDKVSVQSDSREGEKFDHWKAEGITLTDEQKKSGSFELTMPAKNVQLEAVYVKATTIQYKLDVRNGKISGSGKSVDMFYEGTSVTVEADSMKDLEFVSWYVLSGDLELTEAQKKSATMTFTMPACDVTITPVYTGGNTYKLHVINGTITSDDYKGMTEGDYDEGAKVSVACDVISGKMFDHWEADGITLEEGQEKNSSIEIIMPANDVTLEAVYTENVSVSPYKVEVINGLIEGKGTTKAVFYQGQKVTVKANDRSAEGKVFVGWTVIDGDLVLTEEQAESETMTFTMPASDVVIAADYYEEDIYSLYVVRGTITSEKNWGKTYGEYASNEIVSAVCDSISGKVFDHWEAEGIVLTDEQRKAEDLTIIMPANDVILTAMYREPEAETPYLLTVINGYIEDTKLSKGTYFQSTSITTIANDRSIEYKVFDKWVVLKGDLELTEEEAKSEKLQFFMPACDVTIAATYKDTYALIVIDGVINKGINNGKVYGEYFGGENTGADCDVISGYVFDHWEATGITLTDEQATSEKLDIVMPGNDVVLYAVYAKVERIQYGLYIFNGEIIDTGLCEGIFYEADKVTVSALDLSKYGGTFVSWKVVKGNLYLTDDQAKSKTMTFTMPASDVTIMAEYSFGENYYSLYVINGTITSEPNKGGNFGVYQAGEKASVTCDARSGEMFDHWEAKGVTLTDAQTKAKSFELTMPAADVELTAVYTKVPVFTYKVDVINGTLKSNGLSSGEYPKGEKVEPVAGDKPTAQATADITEIEKGLKGLTLTDKGNGNYTFKKWVVVKGNVTLTSEQETSKTFAFEMPEMDVTLAAAYEYVPSGNIPTGDNNRTLPWILAIILSLMAITGGIYCMKRKTSSGR